MFWRIQGVTVASSPQWTTADMSLSSSTTGGWDATDILKGLYTCLACQIGFHSADLQRQHYRTDWYLPARSIVNRLQASIQFKTKSCWITTCYCRSFCAKSSWYDSLIIVLHLTQFANVLLHVAQQDQLRQSASQANYSQTCVPCKKTFYSQNAYNNHLSSKRHRLAPLRSPNRLDALKGDDSESIAGSIGSGTVSLDMVDSVASLDDGSVKAIDDAVSHMRILDEEVFIPAISRSHVV